MDIMPIVLGTLARYFGLRFLIAVAIVFAGIFALVALIDYVEMMRRAGDIPNVPAMLIAKTSIYRVPQVVERILPFCVLIGAMSCYLNLSRRLELVVARSAGLSAWQFVAPALLVAFALGVAATTIYNPISATLQEQSKRFEAELFGLRGNAVSRGGGGPFWIGQRTDVGEHVGRSDVARHEALGPQEIHHRLLLAVRDVAQGAGEDVRDPVGHRRDRAVVDHRDAAVGLHD